MSPVLFEWGPFTIHWYGILVASAFLSGIAITKYYGRKYGLDPLKLEALILRLMVVVIIGARLGFVVTHLDFFLSNPHLIPRVDLGGLASHGAILLSLIMGFWWTRRFALPFWNTSDAVFPAIPLAHIFVRIGNFINGELYGPPTTLPWGVRFPGTDLLHHPTQLYEALTSLLILLLIIRLAGKREYPGQVFLWGMFSISLVRFFIDFLRQTTHLYGPFVLTQLISLSLVLISAAVLWYKGSYSLHRG